MNYFLFLMFFCCMGIAKALKTRPMMETAKEFNPSSYQHTKAMWTSNGQDVYNVYWQITPDEKEIYLALEVKTLGWIGFGIAEQSSGNMGGSDIVRGYVDTFTIDQRVTIEDSYVLSQLPGTNLFAAPISDSCQDWELINGQEINGTTILELKRLIDTGDSQDRPFLLNQPTKIIMAYGADYFEDDFLHPHTPERRKASFINFSGQDVADPLKTFKTKYNIENSSIFLSEVSYFDVLGDWTVTPNTTLSKEQETNSHQTSIHHVDPVTTYINTLHNLWWQLPLFGDFWIIGAEHIISEDTKEVVQLLSLNAFRWNSTTYTGSGPTSVYIWAPGTEPMVLNQCGFKMSNTDPTASNMLFLGAHYHNPHLRELHDKSGIRVYYTTKPPQHDCGYINIGQTANIPGEDNSLLAGKSMHEYKCSATSIEWPVPEITVEYGFLHMNPNGRQIWTEHLRNGESIGTVSRIDFWDYNFQSLQRPIGGSFKFKKGDSFKTSCVYEKGIKQKVKFGNVDAKCFSGYIYYPRIPELDYSCVYFGKNSSNQPQSVIGSVTRTEQQLTEFTRSFGKACQSTASNTRTANQYALSTFLAIISLVLI